MKIMVLCLLLSCPMYHLVDWIFLSRGFINIPPPSLNLPTLLPVIPLTRFTSRSIIRTSFVSSNNQSNPHQLYYQEMQTLFLGHPSVPNCLRAQRRMVPFAMSWTGGGKRKRKEIPINPTPLAHMVAPHPCQHLLLSIFFYYSCSNECEASSYFGFHLYLSNDEMMLHISSCV